LLAPQIGAAKRLSYSMRDRQWMERVADRRARQPIFRLDDLRLNRVTLCQPGRSVPREHIRRSRFEQAPVFHRIKGPAMLYTIALILLILWVLGFSLHIAGGIIHLLLVVAVIVVLVRLFQGRSV
jgi:hypothetical protein